MKNKLLKLQTILQIECRRLGSDYTVIVRQHERTQISVAFFNKDTTIETEGHYIMFDDFYGDLLWRNLETVFSELYLAVLNEGLLWSDYKDKILRDEK